MSNINQTKPWGHAMNDDSLVGQKGQIHNLDAGTVKTDPPHTLQHPADGTTSTPAVNQCPAPMPSAPKSRW